MLLSLSRRAAAEALGTMLLLAAIVGSGVMADTLASGNVAIALLANTIATASALAALIAAFGPLSGAHLNPIVSVMAWHLDGFRGRETVVYAAAQTAGAVAGVMAAHAMFRLPLLSISTHARSGLAMGFSEAVATFGLLFVIAAVARSRPTALPAAVAAYIASAYWFTASTAFANPAVTLARAMTNTFAGIHPANVPTFLGGQLCGAAAACGSLRWLLPARME